jgi:hypothetical protein
LEKGLGIKPIEETSPQPSSHIKEASVQQHDESKPKSEIEHIDMQDPSMVDMSSGTGMHLPAALESELAHQDSVILDTLLKNQETGLVFPFDVASFPIWNNTRNLEDKLYWDSKIAGPSSTPCDDQGLPPDQDCDCSSPKQ